MVNSASVLTEATLNVSNKFFTFQIPHKTAGDYTLKELTQTVSKRNRAVTLGSVWSLPCLGMETICDSRQCLESAI